MAMLAAMAGMIGIAAVNDVALMAVLAAPINMDEMTMLGPEASMAYLVICCVL